MGGGEGGQCQSQIIFEKRGWKIRRRGVALEPVGVALTVDSDSCAESGGSVQPPRRISALRRSTFQGRPDTALKRGGWPFFFFFFFLFYVCGNMYRRNASGCASHAKLKAFFSFFFCFVHFLNVKLMGLWSGFRCNTLMGRHNDGFNEFPCFEMHCFAYLHFFLDFFFMDRLKGGGGGWSLASTPLVALGAFTDLPGDTLSLLLLQFFFSI